MAPAGEATPRLLFVCTGNATRSVIGAALVLRAHPDWPVSSAGTLAVPGQPLGASTRRAMQQVGLEPPRHHRSAALDGAEMSAADLVVGFERHHVAYVRRRWPAAADRTALLTTWVRLLPPAGAPLADRVASLGLDRLEPDDLPDPEVDDPGGGPEAGYLRAAEEISALVAALLPRLP
ncbi:MAG: hypothetical protein R2737_01030 [Candidatus Nanopelagicales bacterium]